MRHRLLLPLVIAGALPACGGRQIAECPATVDPGIHTLVHVTWDSPSAGTSWVEYGTSEDDLDRSTPETEDAGTSHDVVLLGLGALTDVWYRAVTEVDGKTSTCEGQLRTENLSSGLPWMTQTAWDESAADPSPYVLLSILGTSSTRMIVDRDGQVSWYSSGDDRVVSTEAIFANDGSNDVLHNEFDIRRQEDIGVVYRASITNEPVAQIRIERGHHAFRVLDDGTIGYIAFDARNWTDPNTGNNILVAGDDLMEVEPDGSVRTVWSTWDSFEPDPTHFDGNFYPGMEDWSHANALWYEPTRDVWLVSMAHLDTVVEIDRKTGNMLRSFGALGEYQPADDGTVPLHNQHDANFTAWPHLMAFTTTKDPDHPQSGPIEYEIDDAAKTYREVWSSGLHEGPGLYSELLGDARRLPGGDTLAVWGAAGVVREISPDDTLVWELDTPPGYQLGEVTLFDDLYSPKMVE